MPTRPDQTAVHGSQPEPRTCPGKANQTVHELHAGTTTVTFESVARHPPRRRASIPPINEKLPFDNNQPLLTATISRHADSSKTLSPTSPPRSGRRVKKRLKITFDSRHDHRRAPGPGGRRPETVGKDVAKSECLTIGPGPFVSQSRV